MAPLKYRCLRRCCRLLTRPSSLLSRRLKRGLLRFPKRNFPNSFGKKRLLPCEGQPQMRRVNLSAPGATPRKEMVFNTTSPPTKIGRASPEQVGNARPKVLIQTPQRLEAEERRQVCFCNPRDEKKSCLFFWFAWALGCVHAFVPARVQKNNLLLVATGTVQKPGSRFRRCSRS